MGIIFHRLAGPNTIYLLGAYLYTHGQFANNLRHSAAPQCTRYAMEICLVICAPTVRRHVVYSTHLSIHIILIRSIVIGANCARSLWGSLARARAQAPARCSTTGFALDFAEKKPHSPSQPARSPFAVAALYACANRSIHTY